jgi:hypothetical protein
MQFTCQGNSSEALLPMIHNKLHEAESCLRSHQLLKYSRISQHFMELEGSSLCSQELSTGYILSQMNSVHSTPYYLSKINFYTVAYLPHAGTVELHETRNVIAQQ